MDFAGYVLYFLKQPTGTASVATVALGVWLLWDLCFASTTADETARDEADPEPAHARRR